MWFQNRDSRESEIVGDGLCSVVLFISWGLGHSIDISFKLVVWSRETGSGLVVVSVCHPTRMRLTIAGANGWGEACQV